MSRNDHAQTSDEGTGDTTYAFPAHLVGELDAPAAKGVEPRVSSRARPAEPLGPATRDARPVRRFPVPARSTRDISGPASGQRHLPRYKLLKHEIDSARMTTDAGVDLVMYVSRHKSCGDNAGQTGMGADACWR